MTYIKQFEAELRKQYNEVHDEEVFFRWVSEKVLESYRNGISAGKNGAEVKRQGQSRRHGFPSKLDSRKLD